ncbi:MULTISPECIES: hypothetical protein [Xanthomonas]|uniref:hypothetical protein n=1 Tax=Xanthomonas TaxID=338 RepID=UPI002254A468|nr:MULTISPECIES: hypothetical protein [Xanthomonas]MDY4340945.1 hypothetical protein [Xanthomonas sp. LF07-6]
MVTTWHPHRAALPFLLERLPPRRVAGPKVAADPEQQHVPLLRESMRPTWHRHRTTSLSCVSGFSRDALMVIVAAEAVSARTGQAATAAVRRKRSETFLCGPPQHVAVESRGVLCA